MRTLFTNKAEAGRVRNKPCSHSLNTLAIFPVCVGWSHLNCVRGPGTPWKDSFNVICVSNYVCFYSIRKVN